MFQTLIQHLDKVSQHADQNKVILSFIRIGVLHVKMTHRNLGVVIGPTLLRPKVEPLPGDLSILTQNDKKCTVMMACLEGEAVSSL